MNRRVKLKQELQKEIFRNLAKKYGSVKKISINFSLPYSTIKKYACGSRTLPEDLFNKIISEADLDKNKLKFNYLDEDWGRKLGAKRGMASLEKKYPTKLKEWKLLGSKNSALSRLKHLKDVQLDEKLAEFVGVYLGDGTLTEYFIKISGDYRYDLPYYSYLQKLVYEVFGLDSTITKDKHHNTAYLTIFSKELCSFFKNKLGLNFGDKIVNNTIIPTGILDNDKLSLACLRGLIDTDGCVSRRGRNGEQFTVTFYSVSPNLMNQVKNISDKHSIFTFLSKDKKTIGTNSQEKIVNYFKIVGSSNMRHIVRFYQRFFMNETLYQKDVKKYYQKSLYRDIKLPFKTDGLMV